MRPLRLELSGFTCFREPTEVNFEELELFAISGVTGAGKSTLLDAITYALYGETARLGTRVSDTLFSPNLDKLSVRLTFSTGSDVYRVARVSERKGSRAPKNETRLERLGEGAQWRQLPESEKLKDADRKLTEIVGLGYDNFTRAVLLPQGAFDRFLHAKTSERTELLTDLLGLSVTNDMRTHAGQIAREAEARARSTEERLESEYADATPERRRDLNAERTRLNEEQAALVAARQTLTARVHDLKALAALLDERAAVRQQLAALSEQQARIAADRVRLRAAQEADALLPYLEGLESRRQEVARLESQLRRVQTEMDRAEEVLVEAQRTLGVAEEAAGRLPELSLRAEALAEARPLFAQLRARRGALAWAQEPHEPYSDAAWDALQARAQSLPALERARSDATEMQMRLKLAEEAREAALQAHAQAEEALKTLAETGKRAKERRERAEAQYAEAERVAPAARLRPHLHVGEACPVCAQVVTALPPELPGNLEALLSERDEAIKAHSALQDRFREDKGTLGTLESRVSDRTEQCRRASEDLEHRQSILADLAASLGNDDPQPLRAALQRKQRALLAGLAALVWEKTGGRDPEEAHAELTKKRSTLEAALRSAQGVFTEAQRTADRLRSDVAGVHSRLSDARAAQAEAERTFTERLVQTDFEDAVALRAAALPLQQQRALAEAAERYAHDLEALTRQDVALEARVAGRILEPGAFERAEADQRETETRLGVVQGRLGALAGELERLEVQLETAKRLRAERSKLEKTFSLYHTLSRDLARNNFPAYMVERVQDDLAQRASDILRTVTDNRYDLFFREDEYVVLDAWTGAERSARTLSGGESFITSLALALALSDTLAGSKTLGALFLDEGFGTLDAETLEAVARVLESLTDHGRMVGVITHVAALTERLPARLLVQKGVEGSVVAWES